MAASGGHEGSRVVLPVVEPQQLEGGENRHEDEDSPRLKRRRTTMSSLLSKMGAMATSHVSAPQVFTFAHGAATFNRLSVGVGGSSKGDVEVRRTEAVAKKVDEERVDEDSKKARTRRFLERLLKLHGATSSNSEAKAIAGRCACGNELLASDKFCDQCGVKCKDTAKASAEPLSLRKDNGSLAETSLPVVPAEDLLESNVNLERMKLNAEVVHAESVAVSPTIFCEPCANVEVPEVHGSQEMMEVQGLLRTPRRVGRCKRCGRSGHNARTCVSDMPYEQPEIQHRDDSPGRDASELSDGPEAHESNDGSRAVYWQCNVRGCDITMHRIVYKDDPERSSKKAFHLKSHNFVEPAPMVDHREGAESAERPNAVSLASNTPVEGDTASADLMNECITPNDRRKTCKLCGQLGHNSRTCKKRQGVDSVKKQSVDLLKTFRKRALDDRQHYLEEKDTGSLSRSSADIIQSKLHNEGVKSSAGASTVDDSEDETIGALASQCRGNLEEDKNTVVEGSVIAESLPSNTPSVLVPGSDRGSTSTQECKRIDVESGVLAETLARNAPSVSASVSDRGTQESSDDLIGKQPRLEPNIDVRVATLDELQLSAKPLVDLFAKQTFKEQREFVGVTGCTSSRRMCSLLRGVYTKMPSCVGGMPAYQKIRMMPLHADSFENLPVFILWHSKLACWIICDKPKATASAYVYARTSSGHTTADATGEWSVRNEKDTAISFDQDSCLKVVALAEGAQAN